jgi:hypothetical protein
MSFETQQQLAAYKAHVDGATKGQDDSGGVKHLLYAAEEARLEGEDKKKKKADDKKQERRDDLKAMVFRVVFALAGAGGVGGTAYAKLAPDTIDTQKQNEVVHEKLADEIFDSRKHMSQEMKHLGNKIDAEAAGKDPTAVELDPELEAAQKALVEQERKSEVKELLKLTPQELEDVKD